jgi:hypothetical protein
MLKRNKNAFFKSNVNILRVANFASQAQIGYSHLNQNLELYKESWPYAVQIHSIYSGRGNIAGVKRVFA